MRTIKTATEMQALASKWRAAGQRIGFVPTMGNLHAGHLALVERAKELCDRVVVSIYVNPLQFGEKEDFAAYPRTLAEDKLQLEALSVDALFAPKLDSFYVRSRELTTYVEVPGISTELEGASRPGHFRGVATVVCKLFHSVLPHVAVFGEKDYQQLLVVRRMVTDLDLPLTIEGLATRREVDGLAMSSRNAYLSEDERRKAPRLYQILQQLRDQLLQDARDIPALEEGARQALTAAGLVPDYCVIRQAEDLQPAKNGVKSLIILAAAWLGQTRLLDNLRVDLDTEGGKAGVA